MRPLLISILFLSTFTSLAQNEDALKSLAGHEKSAVNDSLLEAIAREILESTTDSQVLAGNQLLKNVMQSELQKEASFTFTFTQLKSISVLSPSDGAFRMFSWSLPFNDGTYRYESAVQFPTSDSIFFLTDHFSDANGDSAYKNSWFPAFYYELIEKKNRFQTYYTLLGWNGNDRLTDKKIIEAMWLNQNGELRFGASIFKTKEGLKQRMVYEFASQNVMKLQFQERLDRIILDHLSPSRETLKGIYEYYGADLSYDAFEWDGNYWIYKEDVDLDQGLKKSAKDFKVSEDEILKSKPIYQPK